MAKARAWLVRAGDKLDSSSKKTHFGGGNPYIFPSLHHPSLHVSLAHSTKLLSSSTTTAFVSVLYQSYTLASQAYASSFTWPRPGRNLTLALEQLAAAAIVAMILQPTNSPQVPRYADIIVRARDLWRWRPELPAGFAVRGILGFGALFGGEYLLTTTCVEGEALGGNMKPLRHRFDLLDGESQVLPCSSWGFIC